MTDDDTFTFSLGAGAVLDHVGNPSVATSMPPIIHAKTVRLSTLLNRGHERFDYLYDFGDDWRHDIVVEDRRDGEADINYPALVDGAGRCPPEDVGGTSGFKVFLELTVRDLFKNYSLKIHTCIYRPAWMQ